MSRSYSPDVQRSNAPPCRRSLLSRRSTPVLFTPYPSYPRNSAKSAAYNLPYILPSSVCSNPCVFTLFQKLPGWGVYSSHFGLPRAPRGTRPFRTQLCPSSVAVTPSHGLLFSSTYKLPNLQHLCFDNVATVGWVGVPNFDFRISSTCPRQAGRRYFPALVGGAGAASRIRTGKRGKAKVPETSSMMLTWQR